MIKLQGRSVLVPAPERCIGVELDHLSEGRTFSLPRYYGSVDLYTASPYIKTQDSENRLNKSPLFPELCGQEIRLTWQIPASCLQQAGRLYFQLQFELPQEGEENLVVWQSEKSFFTVEQTIPADAELGGVEESLLRRLAAQVDELGSELENRGLPFGGRAGDQLVKQSGKDLDFVWGAAQFTAEFSSAQWQASPPGYRLTIPAHQHGMGTAPVVRGLFQSTPQGLRQVFTDCSADLNGAVVLSAHAPFTGRAIITN